MTASLNALERRVRLLVSWIAECETRTPMPVVLLGMLHRDVAHQLTALGIAARAVRPRRPRRAKWQVSADATA